MIKHGKIHKHFGKNERGAPSHIDPIAKFITKGVADAREKVVLQPMACDVRGAKRFDGQQCVIAKAFSRVHKPQAIAVGRSLAYAVFDGLAIRFRVPAASRKLVEEFDAGGNVRKAPITLLGIHPSWRIQAIRARRKTGTHPQRAKTSGKHRLKKYGVRAIGGGVSR